MLANRYLLVAMLCLITPSAKADLTVDQKISDFTQLAALYARDYGPYEAKHDLYGFDLFDIRNWLDQVRASKTDLEFYDVCAKYVASLRDSHDEFTIFSSYEAALPISVDVYDGKVLIDGIDRTLLPSRAYPFRVGDELVSIDGKSMADWIKDLDPYAVNGASNPVSRARIAANLAVDRYQGWWVTAPLSIGDQTKATIVVQRQMGTTESYDIDWQIIGVPNMGEGPIPPLEMSGKRKGHDFSAERLSRRTGDIEDGLDQNPWGLGVLPPETVPADTPVAYEEAIRMLSVALPQEGGSLSPFGATNPVFNPPSGFKLRLGTRSSDFFVSGTFPLGSRMVGFIRVPTMSPASTTAAFAQFAAEIQFLQQNTDGLVVDVMGNGGGSGCYTQSLVSALVPHTFRGLSYEVRATAYWVTVFGRSLANARLNNAPQWTLDLYSTYLAEIQKAASENRGMTGSLPICGLSFDTAPLVDKNGSVLAYTKPILVLTDNFTLSAAEIFTMMLQDEQRATIFGTVTDGGGGNVNSYTVGAYSEGQTRVTQSVITRKAAVTVPGFPERDFYDGVGIAPDITADYMTADNLLNRGKSFVAALSQAIANLIDPPK